MTPHLADTPVLETERLTLRAPVMRDYPAWEAFFASDRARFIGGPGDRRMAWRGFAHVVGMWSLRGFGSFVFEDKERPGPLGMAGPWYPMDWPEREIGWTIWQEEAEGQGFAFEAAEAARAFAYTVLGWPTAVSYIRRGNDRSVALARRLGCAPDPEAALPDYADDDYVYRHPAPETLA